MASPRGEYRAIPTVLLDGPDFQRLPPAARHVFLTLKLSLGSTGIDAFPGMTAALAERTGYDEEMVSRQLAILETFRDATTGVADPWIVRERNVVWVVRHLEFEPSLNPDDPKHRKYVRNHVKGLPRIELVGRFKSRYGAWWADATEDDGIAPVAGFPDTPPTSPSEGASKPLPSPSEAPPEQTTTTTTTRTTGTARPRAARDGRPGPTGLDLLPRALCDAAFDAWQAQIGGVVYSRFRKALSSAIRADALPTAEQLVASITAFSEAREAEDVKWRSTWHPEKWASDLPHWIALGAMPHVDEWGSPTERGKLLAYRGWVA